jgi:hypothetical protein
MSDNEIDIARDLLQGADAIATFLYGDPASRRKVYHLASTSNLPVFKLGAMICARRSILLQWIEKQERRHANDNTPPETQSVRVGKV